MARLVEHSIAYDDALAPKSINERRQAHWLLTDYADHRWIVADSQDQSETKTIDFRIRLADGRCLIEVPALLATVKEYAWWVRDERFARIDDARTHAASVRNLLNLAHALTLKGIWTFAHLGPYELGQLVEDCRYGADAVLQASERLEVHLRDRLAKARAFGLPHGGLPQYLNATTGRLVRFVAVGDLLEDANLPESAAKLPRVAWLIAQAALDNGLKPRAAFDGDIPEFNNLTAQAVQRWLDPLECLWSMRRHIEADALSFRPFPQGAWEVAKTKGAGTARTPTPPPPLALHLMEEAASWVADYSGPLLTALEEIYRLDVAPSSVEKAQQSIIDRLPQQGRSGCPWPIVSRGRQLSARLSFALAIKLLATACWIIVATFSARRFEEIAEITPGSLRGNDLSVVRTFGTTRGVD